MLIKKKKNEQTKQQQSTNQIQTLSKWSRDKTEKQYDIDKEIIKDECLGPARKRVHGATVAKALENILKYSLLHFLMMETDLKASFLRASFHGNRRHRASFQKREQPRVLNTAMMATNTVASWHDNPKSALWQEHLGSQ